MVDVECLLLSGLIICLCISVALLPEIFVDEITSDLNRGSKSLRSGISLHNNEQSHVQSPHSPYTPYKYTPRLLNIAAMPEIICMDGSIGVVNDDYCDCVDGEDEPDTAACSHVLVGKKIFICDSMYLNSQHKLFKRELFVSRIGDGVIDCHDRSDE